MILVFDTETSGLPLFKESPEDSRQPDVIQLAWLLLDDELKEVASYKSLVRPSWDFYIHPGAFAAHHISKERVDKEGIGTSSVVTLFSEVCSRADIVVAHNIKFDTLLLDIASCRSGQGIMNWPSQYCTMLESTNVCKLPGPRGYKWPKLQEAHKFFFGEEFDGAHDAMADVRACVKIYRKLMESLTVARA